MEAAAATAVLKVLVEKLIDLSMKEISQIRGFRKNAEKLAGSLDMIQKFLHNAEMRAITSDAAVKSWLKKLEDVAFDADNVLDEINYHILSKQIKATKPMKAKILSGFSSSVNSIARPRNMAVKIQEINENLESIKKEATDLGLVVRLAIANEPTLVDASLETDSYTLDPIFIGRDDAVSEIVEMLTNTITTDERAVSIISIVGMGGLGKTTLTRKVFNHLKDENQFGLHIWVHVSRNFDAITLLKTILKNLTPCQVENASKEDILAKLKEALEDKTYLLVLDDVWNEDTSKWEDFINSLLGVSFVKGNAIVVTTRSMTVTSIVNPLHTYELKGLSEEECWSIIKEKTFGKEDVPSEFEAIGRKIAIRCQGLPLAANVVGGVLRIKSEEKWLSVEEKWLSADEGGDNIRKILRLSFDNLSLPLLKKCFAYCAMFPKGYQIIKQELIEMWMAEGFLQADGRDDMESVGEKFINLLLHNSLLQVSKRDIYGNVKKCGMHDLVHDLACSVSSSSNSTGGSSRVRYIILGDNYCGDESNRIPKEMAKSLRTLLIASKADISVNFSDLVTSKGDISDINFSDLVTSKGDISDINFSDLESLHVLHLHSEVKKLPSSIRKLIHLRDFDISKTSIEVLPDWIGEFLHLQTLRVELRWLRKLPSTIKYLINLRHLYITEDVELPMGIGRLTSLQTLTHFPVGDQNGCKIEELGSLNNLKGELRILNLKTVHDKEEAWKANLFKKSKILKLRLEWDRYGRREGGTYDEDVLEGLQPHSDLRELEIFNYKGKRFPLWTEKMSVRDAPQGSWVLLNKLMSLTLWNCNECEEIPMLGHLPNLKSLELRWLINLKCINSSLYGTVNKDTRIVFPALERLELYFMPKLAEWAEIEISDGSEVKLFPRLQHLQIMWCKQLTSVPSHVSSCLEELRIEEIGVECLPADWLLSNSETLSKLYIEDCPNLREISDRWGEEESEGRSFTITSLPKFPRLTFVHIEGVPKLSLETVDAILQGCRHSLHKLYLKGMESWECMPESIQHLTSLYFLCLRDFGMEELPEWLGNLSSLKELNLFNCKRLRRLPSMDAMRCLTTLKVLFIEDCPELVIESEATDSEWPKLSHIPSIYIDGSKYGDE
ncbi:putative disease resistance protein RGA3 isoform X2 [Salvia miltiorrhiza]|uniref:putative disease resistance protein RGA3 isoform X2 n=1 Tax=Salvia miltiorrhiza TaxID=226208 RepID=UPI0025AD7B1A|nr:putative disease resistance protein RGA3 isoform X2 [Salvia miltiorrhiza]